MCAQQLKGFLQVLRVIDVFFGFDKHIIDVDFHGVAHQWSKNLGPAFDKSL